MNYRKKFIVAPASKLRLSDIDPATTGSEESAESAAPATARYQQRLRDLQTLLYAENTRSVLIVLQALDAGGKDGTISHVMGSFNPQGVAVTRFERPTPQEKAHDFLWRVHPHAPRRGQIAVFNRSHYEDVLITRVHKQIDSATCKTRLKRIRAFEAGLTDAGTLILKFFLHISKDVQLARFAARLDDRHRNWKISEADYDERPYWNDYIKAYQDALSATSTTAAPWFVIPANHKWFRNLAVSQIIAEAMDDLNMSYPQPTVDLAEIRRKFHAAMEKQSRTA